MTAPKKPKLTDQQELFCHEYLKDLNATQAAIRAGYSAKTAQEQSSRLLSNVMVSDYIYTSNQERLAKVKIDADFVLGELYKIATSDVGDCLNEDGSFKPMAEIPKHLRITIQSFEMIEYFEGPGEDREQVGFIKKVKFWNKDKSLENLGKHLKLFTDKVELSGQVKLEDILTKSREE